MTSIVERTETPAEVELDSREVFAQILLRAADEIDKRGWTFGASQHAGKVCALGGLCYAMGSPITRVYAVNDPAYCAAAEVLADAVDSGWRRYIKGDPANEMFRAAAAFTAIYKWNDKHVLTGGTVVPARLREIAASLGGTA